MSGAGSVAVRFVIVAGRSRRVTRGRVVAPEAMGAVQSAAGPAAEERRSGRAAGPAGPATQREVGA